jgi:hypothetical protein
MPSEGRGQGKGQAKDPEELAQELERGLGAGNAGSDEEKARRNAAKLLRNPKFREVMESLRDNPSAQQEAKSDPKGFLKSRGVEGLDDATITFEEEE